MAKAIEPAYNHWTPLTQADFNEIMLDFEAFCEKGSMIIDKNGQAQKFKLNEAQKVAAKFIILEAFAPVPSPVNLFIHKSRQMGITVLIAKAEQYLCTRIKNFNTQHIMPTEGDSDDLNEKKFIPLLQGTNPELLPETHTLKSRVKFLEFGGVKLDSSVTFSSAQKHGGNRGQTNQMVVEDEQAHYERVEYLERGVIATMPKIGLSIRVVVSTAYGMNHFYDLSKVAKTSNNWKYLFLPWHMLSEYEREPQGRLKELSSLTEYELRLCDIFAEQGYPIETWTRKIEWYNYTLETEAKGDMEHMYENYPSTADESFEATGAPVLPAIKLRKLKEANAAFEYVELTQEGGKVEIKPTNLSTIKRWEKPVQGRKYLFAIDPADGGADGDWTSGVLVDMTTMKCVLSIREHIDQNDMADLVNVVGRIYNNATVVVERNTGQSLIDWLVNINHYPLMYIDPFHTTKARVQYGIYMTRPVKNDAITRAKFFFNNEIYTDYDNDFLDEALHFTWKKTPSGLQKAIGTDGYSDDCVMSRLILFAALDMNKWRNYNSHNKK